MTALKETEDVRAIKSLIQAFFDRINASDPKGLQKLFEPHAQITIVRQDPPKNPNVESRSSFGRFVSETSPLNAASVNGCENLNVVLRISIESFTKLLEDGEKKRRGKPGLPKIHEIPDLIRTDVKVDTLFASAWTPFRVEFDGVLHHYGTLVYTLGKMSSAESREWRVLDLTQKYRRTEGYQDGVEVDVPWYT